MITRSAGEVGGLLGAELGLLLEALAANVPDDACARQTTDRKVMVNRERTAVLTDTYTSLCKVAGLSSQEQKLACERPFLEKGNAYSCGLEFMW